ncbi:hypothetical protein [Caballeronia sp. TF1N1]|uniref:hypothetical protein n=1 Tax=Caballeronia sp. TF1N1 TaxID=2878153 RepID=UPI001FD3EB65|nr:hypothetical protein [Caballeronia sp. TF1N1]
MNQGKKVAFILAPKLIPIEDEFPLSQHKGSFVFKAQCVVHPTNRAFTREGDMTSSRIIRIDIGKGEIETLNTLYKVLPKHLESVYRMTDPSYSAALRACGVGGLCPALAFAQCPEPGGKMNQKEFEELFLGKFEPKPQSELLTAFYQAYLWWLTLGANEDMGFSRYHGLCGALRQWANRNAQIEYRQLSDEMRMQFSWERLDFLHPFHPTTQDYNREVDRGEAHLNPKRIQWVKDHVK